MTARRFLTSAGYTLGLPIILLAGWWIISAGSTSQFWPPLQEIITTFPEVWFNWERLSTDVIPSLLRLAGGYALALVLGIAIGTVIGLWPRMRALAEPVLEFFRAVPPPVLIPVVAVFVGYTGSSLKIVAIAIGAIWPILLNTAEGVRGLDPTMNDTARSYRIGWFRRMIYVTLPGASPRMFTGMRQALSIAVIVMVIAEIFGSTSGLGATLEQFRFSFAYTKVWTMMIMLGIIGVLLAGIFALVERNVLAWYHGQQRLERGE